MKEVRNEQEAGVESFRLISLWKSELGRIAKAKCVKIDIDGVML